MSILVDTTANKVIQVTNISGGPVNIQYMKDYHKVAILTLAAGGTATIAVTAAQLSAITALSSIITVVKKDAPVEKALSGDIVFTLTPATCEATAAAQNATTYERSVVVKLTSAAGEVHTWFNGDIGVTVAEVTAGNGAIATADATPTMVNGVCTVVITYTGTFATADTNTLTVSQQSILGYTVAAKTSVETTS